MDILPGNNGNIMLSIHLKVKQPIFWMTTFTCKIPPEMSAHLLGD